MKSRTRTATQLSRFLVLALFLTLAPAALASSTWYVDGVNGNDINDCLSSQTACQTIGHAISLCSSGDSVMVAPAVYTENLTIKRSLKIIGAHAATTIVDGNQAGSVFTIRNAKAHVHLSNLTIRNGFTSGDGGGVYNRGNLTINKCTVSGNAGTNDGGGIENNATLILDNSTISGNTGTNNGGGISNHAGATTINKSTISGNTASSGSGIHNHGTMTINKSTIIGNSSSGMEGGGIFNDGYYATATLTIDNSTISGNSSSYHGGGIFNSATLTINNSTFNGNRVPVCGGAIANWALQTISNSTISGNIARCGGGIYVQDTSTTLQNSIVANNSGGNCAAARGNVNSNGYNLSDDDTCSFTGPGDLNNTDPKLGKLGNHGGPTQTIPLLSGSPAIDAGNPNGCTDDKGNVLKTDQRGQPRPGRKDTGGCDIGAFELQRD